MPYALVEDVAASWEQYEPIATALAQYAPPGLIVHAAGPTDEGFRIIEVWESEEAWRRFAAERLIAESRDAGGVRPIVRTLRPEHMVYGEQPGREIR